MQLNVILKLFNISCLCRPLLSQLSSFLSLKSPLQLKLSCLPAYLVFYSSFSSPYSGIFVACHMQRCIAAAYRMFCSYSEKHDLNKCLTYISVCAKPAQINEKLCYHILNLLLPLSLSTPPASFPLWMCKFAQLTIKICHFCVELDI